MIIPSKPIAAWVIACARCVRLSFPKLSFSFRLILVYFLLIGAVAWFIVSKSVDVLDSSVRQAAEEVMIDVANLVAEVVERDIEDARINADKLQDLMSGYLARKLNAKIYSVHKTEPNLHIYITDSKGILLYDSAGEPQGADYSEWRDVWLTLKGEYGARSTDAINTTVMKDSVMYVAAPVQWQGDIIGVVSVSKHVNQFNGFVALANKRLRDYSIALLIASLVFGGFITWWLARSIRKLVRYADGLGSGEKLSPPKLHEKELQSLAYAMSDMQTELQDKQYVENYLHTLAHELKSPLTGIKGAVELLQEEMPVERKQQFVDNIGDSAERMLLLIERLLRLAQVEKRQHLENVKTFRLFEVIERLITSRAETLKAQSIEIDNAVSAQLEVKGEALLIEQAIANLLDNSIDFSASNTKIKLTASSKTQQHQISITDQGGGIPQPMQEKVFERFKSTPRPGSKKRSTGLGLSFVKEVMLLHNGEVKLNNTRTGLCVTLNWLL